MQPLRKNVLGGGEHVVSSAHFRALDDSAPAVGMLGRIIAGKFEIESILGEGAMGVVFRARHISLDVPVALKVLHRELATDERFSSRFKREAKIACSVAHANSVRVIDCGAEADGTLYLAMEFVDGHDLYSVLQERGRLSPGRAAHLMCQVLSALGAAHAAGIVHRDVKPENVLIVMGTDDEGEPNEIAKVCDFGIASMASGGDGRGNKGSRLTMQGLVVGTPAYMSPEQARGLPIDARSDIYAAGIVLYQILTGSLPFDADEPLALVLKHVSETPPLPETFYPEVHTELAAVALMAMQKEPSHRFQSARAMRGAIRRVMGWGDVDAYSTRSPSGEGSPLLSFSPEYLPRSQSTPAGMGPARGSVASALAITERPAPSSSHPPPGGRLSSPRAPRSQTPPAFQIESNTATPARLSTSDSALDVRRRGRGSVVVVAALATIVGAWAVARTVARTPDKAFAGEAPKSAHAAAEGPASADVAGGAAFARPRAASESAPTGAGVGAGVIGPVPPSGTTTWPAVSTPPKTAALPTPIQPAVQAVELSARDRPPAFVAGTPGVAAPEAPPNAPAAPALPPPPTASLRGASAVAATDTVAPAPPVATVEPAPAALPVKKASASAARVVLGAVAGERGVTPRNVTAGIVGAMPRILECYRAAFSGSPGAGNGVLHVDTDGDGVVTSASARVPIAPAAARCIERNVVGVQFSGVDTGEATADVALSFHDE